MIPCLKQNETDNQVKDDRVYFGLWFQAERVMVDLLVGYHVNLTQPRLLGEGASIRLASGGVCGALSLLLIDSEGPKPLGVEPSLVRLAWPL